MIWNAVTVAAILCHLTACARHATLLLTLRLEATPGHRRVHLPLRRWRMLSVVGKREMRCNNPTPTLKDRHHHCRRLINNFRPNFRLRHPHRRKNPHRRRSEGKGLMGNEKTRKEVRNVEDRLRSRWAITIPRDLVLLRTARIQDPHVLFNLRQRVLHQDLHRVLWMRITMRVLLRRSLVSRLASLVTVTRKTQFLELMQPLTHPRCLRTAVSATLHLALPPRIGIRRRPTTPRLSPSPRNLPLSSAL